MDFGSSSISELVKSRRGALAVLQRHGLDFYRDGNRQLSEIAARQQIELDPIISDLGELGRPQEVLPRDRRGLIRYIEDKFHAPHINRLNNALRLARLAEGASETACPPGLALHIKCLVELVEEHQEKERDCVFPALIFSPKHNLRFKVLGVMMEHDELLDELDSLARLTGNYTPAPNAPEDLCAVYRACRTIDEEMRFHIYLENNLLYARHLNQRPAA